MLLSLVLTAALAVEPDDHGNADAPASNDAFLAEQIDVGSWTERFERAEREVYARRRVLVGALGLKRGQTVADVGAGTGAMLDALVAAIGRRGLVLATELSPAFRAHLTARADAEGWRQVRVVESGVRTTGLPDQAVDAALLVDVYHHLEAPEAFVRDLARALRPGGTLAVVDFDPGLEDATDWVREHVWMTADAVRAQVIGTGLFEALPEVDVGMRQNRMLRFRRSAAATP